jgi:hypothetical protein
VPYAIHDSCHPEATLEAAEKVALADGSYQGMTSVMPQDVENTTGLQPLWFVLNGEDDFFSSLFSRRGIRCSPVLPESGGQGGARAAFT